MGLIGSVVPLNGTVKGGNEFEVESGSSTSQMNTQSDQTMRPSFVQMPVEWISK